MTQLIVQYAEGQIEYSQRCLKLLTSLMKSRSFNIK